MLGDITFLCMSIFFIAVGFGVLIFIDFFIYALFGFSVLMWIERVLYEKFGG